LDAVHRASKSLHLVCIGWECHLRFPFEGLGEN